MLDRKLIDYLPPVLQSVMEFAAITDAQQPEIEAVWDALDLVMNNQFIDTATEAGVKLWEQELGIVPLASDTLEDRKARILFQWNNHSPYTMKYLKEKLYEVCGDNYEIELNDYTLKILTHLSVYGEIENIQTLSENIPANILRTIINDTSPAKLYNYFGIKNVVTTSYNINADMSDLIGG